MSTFTQCLVDTLKGRHYGPKRIRELEARFAGKTEAHTQRGTQNPAAAAWAEIFEELTEEAARASRISADAARRINDANRVANLPSEQKIPVSSWYGDGIFLPRELSKTRRAARRAGVQAGVALKSQIEADARVGGLAQQTLYRNEWAAFWRQLGAEINELSKGVFGQQLGIRRQDSLGRAIFGETTQDAGANRVGAAYNSVNQRNVARLRGYGVDIQHLAGRGLSAQHSIVRMTADRAGWVDLHLREDIIDWDRTVFPDTGAPVRPDQRRRFLEGVYDTKTAQGTNKLTLTDMYRSGGYKIGAHRVVHYQNYDAWKAAHDAFGEGTVFDALAHEVDQMAHALSMAQKFGRDPAAWLETQKIVAAQRLQEDHGAEARKTFEDYNSRITEPMLTLAVRQNVDVSESGLATAAATAANLITSSWLGAVTLVAVPTDLVQSSLIRHMSGLRTLPALRDTVRLLAQDSKATFQESLAYGHVVDEHIMGMRAQSRYLGGMGEGLAAARWAAGATMRANGNSRWTTAMRQTNAREWGINAFAGMRDRQFSDLPWREAAERYGITRADWDEFRSYTPTQVANGVFELSPSQALDAGNIDLFHKFAGMINVEQRRMIIDTTLESQVMLRSGTQPNNLVGVMLRSFSMFKMFPVTFLNVMTRTAATQRTAQGKMAFLASAAISLTVAGAFAVQMKEVSKGRDVKDMEDPAFWGQAFLTGGAGGFVADILFNGTTEYGRGIPQAVAGPLLTTVADATSLVLTDPFKWVTAAEGHEQIYTSASAGKAVDFVGNLIPGQSLWYGRAFTESARLAVRGLVDPKGTESQLRRRHKRAEDAGQGYWWEPGAVTPSRPPRLGPS